MVRYNMDGNSFIVIVNLYSMNKHPYGQKQRIVEIDIPKLRVHREEFRRCPICLKRSPDKTLSDPCMLSVHLHGPIHSKEDIVEFLLDEIQAEDIFDYLQ